ncbi:MAG: adenylosuccinate synthetase [Candidatus Baldrarchaeota archaeon]
MPCEVVVGGFFGDEGKGKIISYLALRDKPAVIARAGVGTNAGHTVVINNKLFKLRQIPSGFTYEKARLLIGPGVLVNPEVFFKEIEETNCKDRVGIDYQCGVIERKHIEEDKGSSHLHGKIGSTGSGCGPANAERALRRLKIAKDISELQPYLTDVPLEINEALDRGEGVLIEGTQGTYLSLYHGTYPFVTSKDVCAAAACSDVGIGPTKVDDVIVVFKAYVTRVGSGPLEGELPEEEAKKRGWLEIATVTGRKRRSAPFNFKLAKRAVMLNGATQIALTKIDIVFPETRGITKYDELPAEAKKFIEKIEQETGVPVTLIGTGPEINAMIDRRDEIKLK